MADKPSTAFKALVIASMLTFGTFTVVIQKLIFNMEGKNRWGGVENFEKPWFQTEVMFIGMIGCLIVYEVRQCIKKKKSANTEAQPLITEKDTIQESESGKKPLSKGKQYIMVAAPAVCDMVATSMMNIGLVWVPASVWQMLRGSMTIFSAVFSKFCLKRPLHASHWIGVCVVAFALCVVAFSALMTPSATTTDVVSSEVAVSSEGTSTGLVGLGCALVVIAQIIQASQIVLEEFLLKDIALDPVLIVGLEGLWGCLCCALVLFIVSNVPEPIGEDGINTLYMLFHNGKIAATGTVYALVILFYNLFGMYVTQCTSAVIRTILEGLRCACIWVVNLFIHYVISKRYGEIWTDWSYLQFCGFLLLLLGLFLYNGILRIQGLYYEDQAPAKKAEAEPEVAVEEQKA